MCKILIFGGTTEGRLLAEFCAENQIAAIVSVATDYGASLLQGLSGIQVRTGRMDASRMALLMEEGRVRLTLDATHPYAVSATENIQKACEQARCRYVRVKRQEAAPASGLYFDSMEQLVDYLNTTEGTVLLTIGSKELPAFCRIRNFEKRCVVRMLPGEQGILACRALGFAKERIIAEKGPYTKEQNLAQLEKFHARYLVTKESGVAGGFEAKAAAADACGASLLILRRPKESGVTLEEAKKILLAG